MESFQISLQPGCRTSTANGAFAMGRIRQGRRRLRPDCECKGTAKYSHTQEKHMKKFENSSLYRRFWGIQIAKHRKTRVFSHFGCLETDEDKQKQHPPTYLSPSRRFRRKVCPVKKLVGDRRQKSLGTSVRALYVGPIQ